MRIQLADARESNAALLRELGTIQRTLAKWIETTNPALWNTVRQRLDTTASITEILEHFGMDRDGAATSSDPGMRLQNILREIRPSLAQGVKEQLSANEDWGRILERWEMSMLNPPTPPAPYPTPPTIPAPTAPVLSVTPSAASPIIPEPSPKLPQATASVLPAIPLATPEPPAQPTIAAQSPTPITNNGLSAIQKQIVTKVGEGYFLDRHIVPPEQDAESRRFSEELANLAQMGALVITDLELGISRHSLKFCEGLKSIRLTALGEQLYTQITGLQPKIAEIKPLRGDAPMRVPGGWGEAVSNYASLESYVLVRATKAAIINAAGNAEAKYPPRWQVRVFDMMDPLDQIAIRDDAEYAETLQKAGRTFQTRWQGAEGGESIPDLIVLMKPVSGGVSTIMLVEVERAKYSKQGMIEKLRRNILAYPPYPFCYIFPTDALMGQVFGLFKDDVIDPEIRRNGLPNGVKVLFTDIYKVTVGAWWSVEQASKAAAAVKAGRGKGENTKTMPKFWMEPPQERPFDKAEKTHG